MSVDNQTNGYGTALGGEWIEAPVLGVVDALTGGFAGELLGYAVAIVATLVLSQAANAGMVGIARTSYTLAVHRQIPRGVARLHPRYGTPWIVLLIFTVLAGLLLLPLDIELLAGMFAYGALIAFALAHLSVCVLRFKEPDRPARLQGAAERAHPRPRAAAAGSVRRGRCRSPPGWRPSSTTTTRACSARSGWAFGLLALRRLPLPRGALADPPGGGARRAHVARARGRVRADPGARLRRGAGRRHHEHGGAARERRSRWRARSTRST